MSTWKVFFVAARYCMFKLHKSCLLCPEAIGIIGAVGGLVWSLESP